MKKLLTLSLVAILVLALAVGCTPKSEPATTTDTGLKDGTYTAAGETDSRGYTPEISISVADGKITEVKYDESYGMKKSQDTAYHENFKSKKDVDLPMAYASIQESLIATQDPSMVDAYTGATHSSDNFKALATEALKDAKDGDKYKDGNYSAKGAEDERGWTPMASITVEEGKITKAVYDEVSSNTILYKSADEAYHKRFMDIKGVDIVDAYKTLESSLVEKQDATMIDAYTGATHAHDSFVELAKKALEEAK